MTSSTPFSSDLDVLVIGAGAAGIGAARRLARTQTRFAVIEARDRIGGRAHTIDAQDHGLDMGCGWLHSAEENPLAARVEPMGLTLDKTPPPWGTEAFNLTLTPAEQDEARAVFAAFGERVEEAAQRGEDRAASDLFEPGGRWNGRIDAISGALNGARFAQVSTLDYAAYGGTEVNWRVVEGYGRLIQRLGEGLPILTDCAAIRIDRSRAPLVIETTRGTVRARAVILTLPTALIASEAVRIEPPVSSLIEAAWGVPLGLASKLHLSLEGAEEFPSDGQLWGRNDTADTGGYHLRPFGRAMIEAYFGGNLAWGLEREGPGAMADFATEELVGLLGSGFRRRITPVATSAWGVDPWSQGAYSHALPGHAADRARLKAPVEGGIFIAGEATADAHYGTAHGAWTEGERAAEQALAALVV